MKQSEIFASGEGQAWLDRNRNAIGGDDDPILNALHMYSLEPKKVLEVGCSNGWRLQYLRERYKCEAFGIDPVAYENRFIDFGTAEQLDYIDHSFDMVIYGFCLYLCDREDLFKIAAEGDRVLQDGGYLVIWDFHPPSPHARPYKHKDGVLSYKMDYSRLWLGNPAYSLYSRNYFFEKEGDPTATTAVTILKKNLSAAWPVCQT